MAVVFVLVSVLFLVQFALAILFMLRANQNMPIEGEMVANVSVIIPFHNEENRLRNLLHSLNLQHCSFERIELIFVDDHSTDQSAELIRNTLKIPFILIQSSLKKGKKFALHEGIVASQNAHILTLDADVELPTDYFSHLLQCPADDMVILPVRMTGNTFFQVLSSFEFKWLQALTFGSKKPLLCNGANLLFSKLSYLNAYRSRTDFDLASGDDVFLLQNFTHYKRRISRLNTSSLTVSTAAPRTLSTLLKQRRRWVGKFNRLADKTSITMTFLLLLLQIAFIVSCMGCFVNSLFAIPLILKFMSELILAYDERSLQKPTLFLANMFHHIWYPFYLVLLLIPQKIEDKWS